MAQVRQSSKKFKRMVALDGHRLGLVSGSVLALIVMTMCFYYQAMEPLATATRVGWSFVAGYGAMFFLIRLILRTTLLEFMERKDPKSKARSSILRRSDMPPTAEPGIDADAEMPMEFAEPAMADLGIEPLGDPGAEVLDPELATHAGIEVERLGAGGLGVSTPETSSEEPTLGDIAGDADEL